MGSKSKRGYGRTSFESKGVLLHRLIFCLANNLDYNDDSFMVCHKPECNRPSCWEVDHLYKGDAFSNANDKLIARTDKEASKTHCPRGHPYDRQTIHNGKIYRSCYTCHREWDKQRKEKK